MCDTHLENSMVPCHPSVQTRTVQTGGTTASLAVLFLEHRVLEYPCIPCAGEPGKCSASGAG